MTPRIAKVDRNQPQIVEALRAVGATVQHIHTVGKGCPDLLVGFRGVNFILEAKYRNAKLTPDEERWHDEWEGQVDIVRTVDDALTAIGALE